MMENSIKRNRLRSILIVIILATLPCYLLGMIIVWIGNSVKNVPTATPTQAISVTVTPNVLTPTLPIPTVRFATPTITLTPTNTVSPTVTATYFIPSSTPSITPTATNTATETPTATASATEAPVPPP
jgi:hypothetical protein